jgi:hypothetical protein
MGWAELCFPSRQTPRKRLRVTVTCSRSTATQRRTARSCGNAEAVLASPGIDPGTDGMRVNIPAIEIISCIYKGESVNRPQMEVKHL